MTYKNLFMFLLLISSACFAGYATTTFNATADTYTSIGYPTTNYGTINTMRVSPSSCTVDSKFISYQKFDISSVGYANVVGATLYLYTYEPDTGYSDYRYMYAYSTSSSAWTEAALTWDTQPTLTYVSSSPGYSTNFHSHLNVTMDITSIANASNTVSVAEMTTGLYCFNTADGRTPYYATREYAAANPTYMPKIIVTYNRQPNLTATSTTSPVTAGAAITLNATFTDADNTGTCTALICKTNSLTGTACTGGQWSNGTGSCSSSSSTISTSYTTTSADRGTNNYYAFVCDNSGAGNACSAVSSGTFVVNNNQPTITTTLANPTNMLVGATTNLSAVISDADSIDTHKLYVCKTNAFTTSCTGGQWCNNSFAAGTTVSCSYTDSLGLGSYQYYMFVCDNSSTSNNCSTGSYGTFNVITPTFVVTSEVVNPLPAYYSNNIFFNTSFYDTYSNKSYKLLVCPTNSINSSNHSCTATQKCYSSIFLDQSQNTTDTGVAKLYLANYVGWRVIANSNLTSLDQIQLWLYRPSTSAIYSDVTLYVYAWNTNVSTTIAGSALGTTVIPHTSINATTPYAPMNVTLTTPVRNSTTNDYYIYMITTTGDSSNYYGVGGANFTNATTSIAHAGGISNGMFSLGSGNATASGWIGGSEAYNWYFSLNDAGSWAAITNGELWILRTTAGSWWNDGVSLGTIGKITVLPSTTYTFSYSYWQNSTGADYAIVQFDYYYANGTRRAQAPIQNPADSTWTQYNYTFTTAATDVYVRIAFLAGFGTTNAMAKYDNVTLTQTSTVPNVTSKTPQIFYPTLTAVTNVSSIDCSMITAPNAYYHLGNNGDTQRVAQSFIPSKKYLSSIEFTTWTNVGSPTFNTDVTIQTDNAGSPSGTSLAFYSIPSATWNAYGNNVWNVINLPAILTNGTLYWIVFTPSAQGDASNYRTPYYLTSSNAYAGGSTMRYNGTAWVAVNYDMDFKVNYAKKAEDMNVTVGNQSFKLTSPNSDGLLTGATWTLNNSGTGIYSFYSNNEGSCGATCAYAQANNVYSASVGGVASGTLCLNGWICTQENGMNFQAPSDTTVRDIIWKVNTIYPVTSVTIVPAYYAPESTEVAVCNNNVDYINLTKGGSKVAITTSALNGNSTFYIRMRKNATSSYGILGIQNITATLNTSTLSLPTIYSNTTTALYLTSNSASNDSTQDPSLEFNLGYTTSNMSDIAYQTYSNYQPASNPINCNYTAQRTDMGSNTWYAFVCRDYLEECTVGFPFTFDIGCGGQLYRYIVEDEENDVVLNATHGDTYTTFDSSRTEIGNQSFADNETDEFLVCVSTDGGEEVADSIHDYFGNSSYDSRRYYYLWNATLTTYSEENITLYAIHDDYSRLIQFTVKDQQQAPVEDAFIYFQRYYPSTNEYKLVAMAKTNQEGIAEMYLRADDVNYRMVIMKDGVILKTFSPQELDCSQSLYYCAIFLDTSPDSTPTYFDYMGHQAAVCTNSTLGNGTFRLTCTVSDTANLQSTTFTLSVYKLGVFNISMNNTCEMNYTGASGTVWCDIPAGEWENQTYSYTLKTSGATYDPIIEIGYLKFKVDSETYDRNSAILSVVFFIMPFIFIPIHLAVVPLVVSLVVVVSSVMGLLMIDTMSMASLLFAFVVTMIYLFR